MYFGLIVLLSAYLSIVIMLANNIFYQLFGSIQNRVMPFDIMSEACKCAYLIKICIYIVCVFN